MRSSAFFRHVSAASYLNTVNLILLGSVADHREKDSCTDVNTSSDGVAHRAVELSVVAPMETFESFFAAQHGPLFSALCAVTGSRQEAEEIMQEAFLKMWERWDRISGLEDPVGYLYRTAMNVFRHRYRRAKLSIRKAVGLAEQTDAYAAVDARDAVIRGLRTLTPQQRAAVVLTSLRGYSSEEAARMLGASASTVRMLASRGRAAMRRSAEEDA